jgi:hypothetical protein
LASFRLSCRPLRACVFAEASPKPKNPRSERLQNFLKRSRVSQNGINFKGNAAKNSPIGFGLEQSWIYLRPGGKGSHRKFRHPRIFGSVVLSGGDGDDAHHYQEKQVRNAIREATK